MNSAAPDPRRWRALAVVCAAFFMTVLDVTVVNVALPSIGTDLHVREQSLQWIAITYAITFGGFLLLGGRAGDLLGRRRMFFAGLALFTLASLVCGLATSLGMLVAARAVQGLGAAVITPATLSIITTTFEEGSERNKALGIWGAMGGSGAAAGSLVGGFATRYLGWEWIFFINVPVGALALALTPRLVRESRLPDHKRFDLAGAVTVTAGVTLLVFAISKAPDFGWGSGRTIGTLLAGAALIVAFLAIETRATDPLMPFGIFRIRTVTGANIVGGLLAGVVYSNFFLLTLYVQQVLGFSALKTGVTFLATAGTVVIVAGLAQTLATRIGTKPVLSVGMLLMTVGMVLFTQISAGGSFLNDLLAGYLVIGFGLPFSYIAVSIAALAGVEEREAGLASGLLNTSQQVGGAVGLAVAATVATTHTSSLLESGHNLGSALTGGFSLAFWVLAGIGAAGTLAAVFLVRREEVAGAESVTVSA
jgi:EmrB/QacA subfamily drug resistance transporter